MIRIVWTNFVVNYCQETDSHNSNCMPRHAACLRSITLAWHPGYEA